MAEAISEEDKQAVCDKLIGVMDAAVGDKVTWADLGDDKQAICAQVTFSIFSRLVLIPPFQIMSSAIDLLIAEESLKASSVGFGWFAQQYS